jgi:putative oxygen-independent coproporphyrinogen III oxidase
VTPLAPPRALYIHVPFCVQICPYCDFHKMRRAPALVDAYLARLEAEAAALAARYPTPLDTLYIGGGTPSHLHPEELERIFAAVERGWGGLGRIETTLEADPGTFDRARARDWRARGVTRLSIGVQSTQGAVLRFLGRSHTADDGLRAIADGLAAGLRVSADAITAIPGQDAAADLRALATSGAQHISVYSLTIEPDTPFGRRRLRIDEERAADDFDLADTLLQGHGFLRYEVSNHARPGFEAAHNQIYWRAEGCLALGPSAVALLPPDPGDPSGTMAVRSTAGPIKGWLLGAGGSRQTIDALELVRERLMTGLRTRAGVDLDALQGRTGIDVRHRFPRALAHGLKHRMLQLAGAELRATSAGLRVLNAVLRPFFAED